MLYAGEHVTSLDDYLRAFDITLSVMQTEEGARAHRVRARRRRVERERARTSRCATRRCSTRATGLRPAQVVEAVLRGLRTAKRELGIRYGVILCAIRSLGPESSLRDRRAVRRVQEPRRRRLRSRGQRGQQPGEGSPPGVPARHRQQHQLHRARRRVVRSGLGPPGDPQVRRASHRSRHAARRERRPAQLRQRSPHPARGVPVVELADARGGELGDPPGRLLRRLRPARDDQHRQPADVRHDGQQGAPPLPQALRLVARRRSRRSSSRASRARSCRTARRRTSSPRSAASWRPSSSRPRSRSSLCHEHEAGRRQRVAVGVRITFVSATVYVVAAVSAALGVNT